MGVLDWKHWLVLLIVVLLVFGSKNLKRLGGDLGASIKGFRRALNDETGVNAPVGSRDMQE